MVRFAMRLALIVLMGIDGESAWAETVTVAVASSLYPAMQQQVRRFEQQHDATIRLVVGSTGSLYNQITQGAPFDLLIAADRRWPALLARHGKVVRRVDVGHGWLGIVIAGAVTPDPKRLTANAIRHIVIANPETAPFGVTARRFLKRHKLWNRLKPKLIYAKNAMQARMMVDQRLVAAGLVPTSQSEQAIATIPYIGVLLHESAMGSALLAAIARP